MVEQQPVKLFDVGSNPALSAILGSSLMVGQWALNPLMEGSIPPSSVRGDGLMVECRSPKPKVRVRFFVAPPFWYVDRPLSM